MAEDASVAETADPDIPFHPLEQELVIDFRSCSEIPYDPDTGGVKAFRAIIFGKGKGVHVPGMPGHMVVAGDWCKQETLCLVHRCTLPPP